MRLRTRALGVVLAAAAALTLELSTTARRAGATGPEKISLLSPREQALHVLNRLGFGPRPGDVERVLQTGVGRYVEQQLHPEKIADTSVAAKLQSLPTLEMSNAELFNTFERPLREARRQRKAEADGGQDADLEKQVPSTTALPANRPRSTAARRAPAARSQGRRVGGEALDVAPESEK